MKKTLILISFLGLLFTSGVSAQSYANAFVVNVGAVQDGLGGTLNYNYFIDRHDFIEGSLFITSCNYKYLPTIKIPYNDFTFNLGYSKNIFYNYQNTLNINLNGGGVFGYETVNNGQLNLSNGSIISSKPGFIYGAYLGLDVDFSLTDQYSIVLKTTQFYHANSTLGEFIPYAGLGFRFYTD